MNSVAPFILRKLLILHKATIARTATVAQVGYSFGTHSLSRLTFEVAVLPQRRLQISDNLHAQTDAAVGSEIVGETRTKEC